MRSTMKTLSVAIILACGVNVSAEDKTPDLEEMWKIIQQQQAMLEAQKQEIERLKNEAKETEQKVEATVMAVEDSMSASGNTGNSWYNKTSIGGYGEVHYNNLENQLATGSDKDMIDVHRFVLYVNHEFTEDVRFVSELELEHSLAGDGKPGEVELEQAYIEYDLNDTNQVKAGMFLMPVGMINETHEPPTFYGVERNPVEGNIIPTTWWEAGISWTSQFDNGFSTDLALSSGLYLTPGSSFKIRSGRQKVAEAKADSGALHGRIKYTGIPGLTLALTGYYQGDYNQGETTSEDALSMIETHLVYNIEQFTIKALYASWDLDGTAAAAIGADKQKGWFIEPSYRLNDDWGIFARYNRWDNAAGDGIDSAFSQIDIGVSYWLTEDVVFKADYQNQSSPSGANEYDGFNLGVGYQF